MSSKGILYLIPNTLGDNNFDNTIPNYITQVINDIDHYVIENVKMGRRYLKRIGIKKEISDLYFYELNKRTTNAEKLEYLTPLKEGRNMGVISDAGCPGVADPGSEIVELAHKNGIKVVPLVGPSSILLALMASGFNGQRFTFHGYLPKDQKNRIQRIKELEKESNQKNQTQIFIETPYRNDHLLEDLIKFCKGNTFLCLATDLTLSTEKVISQPVHKWKMKKVSFHKKPTVFLIYSNSNF